jgi:HSP20 family protein
MTHLKFSRPIESSFNSFVDDLFSEFPAFLKNDHAVTNRRGSVPVNITESDEGYRLEVIVPGYEKNDFKINLDQNLLTVSGEKKVENKSENEKKIRREYEHATFKRTFTLNEKVDATRIGASYINGVLVLNLPKKEVVKESAKEIEVK